MSEEYLPRENSDLSWFLVVVGVIALLMVIGHLTGRNKEPESRKKHLSKFVWAALCLLIGYFFVTVPYTGYFYQFGSTLEQPQAIESNESAEKYLKNHHHRITTLERELGETREQLRKLRDHYLRILQLVMLFVFGYGFSQILKSNHKVEIDKESILKL